MTFGKKTSKAFIVVIFETFLKTILCFPLTIEMNFKTLCKKVSCLSKRLFKSQPLITVQTIIYTGFVQLLVYHPRRH